MGKTDDLKYIKIHYGEKMMKLCRELFPTILETPGKLSKIMEDTFYSTKGLYYDIVNNNLENQFKDYINKKTEIKQVELLSTNKTPFELMKEAGYELIECKTEEDIQSFIKYYKDGEALCTFNGGRLKLCHVFFAVKKDAEKLKREDFKKPIREDEYGTSVISIQFSKHSHTLSIKNRYNHTVNNPDATFGNNLENIIPGLTKSFEEYYGHEIKQSNEERFEIPNYVEVDGKFYKYNYEINNIYYCPKNIIIKNGKLITKYSNEPERYIVMDHYILDIKEKKISKIDCLIHDGFVEIYNKIEKIEITTEKDKKRIIITNDGKESIITINNNNQIIEYKNNEIEELYDRFMGLNDTLEQLELEKVKKMGNYCFLNCKKVKKLELPCLQELGTQCFCRCESLKILKLHKLEKIASHCFYNCKSLEELDTPRLKIIGGFCFYKTDNLKELSLLNAEEMGSACFITCNSLQTANIPQLKKLGENCFHECIKLETLNIPNLEKIGSSCFGMCGSIRELNLCSLKKMGMLCFEMCSSLRKINIPVLQVMPGYCFVNCINLEEINMPQLKIIEDSCFVYNNGMEAVVLPQLETISDGCFRDFTAMKKIYAPKLEKCYSEKIDGITSRKHGI